MFASGIQPKEKTNSDETRWEQVRGYYRESPLRQTNLHELSRKCGVEWFASRRDDTPATFIDDTWEKLAMRRGFGPKKCHVLLELLESNVPEDFEPSDEEVLPETDSGPEALEIDGWDKLPLSLSFFSARSRSLFDVAEVSSPAGLVEWYTKVGDSGVLSYRNSGKKTLDEIQALCLAWNASDPRGVQNWLPLDADSRFTLEQFVIGHYHSFSEDYQAVIDLRLVDGETLQACGDALEKTRERIRQIEKLFLAPLDEALSYFSEDRDRCLASWKDSGRVDCSDSLSEAERAVFEVALRHHFEKSEEGTQLISEREERAREKVEAIRDDWRFYCGEIDLSTYLSGEPDALLADTIKEIGEGNEYWKANSENGWLEPLKFTKKRAALACLNAWPEGEVRALAWLSELQSSYRFCDTDIDDLYRLYSYWRADPAFERFLVDFTEPEVVIPKETEEFEDVVFEVKASMSGPCQEEDSEDDNAAEERLEKIRQALGRSRYPNRTISPVRAGFHRERAVPLEAKINELIERSQEISSEDTLLGFLNVDESLQEEVFAFFREEVRARELVACLRLYPALTSYCLSVASAVGLLDESVGSSSVYKAWVQVLGDAPSQSMRKVVAENYCIALKRLGLPIGKIDSDHDFDYRGNCYYFHSGVLEHYVPHMLSGLKSAQKVRPLPDPEDQENLRRFANLMAAKVNPGQQRLRGLLRSEAGLFLVRRLVLWYLTEEDDLFPYFVEAKLRESRNSEKEAVLHGPFVIFSEREHDFFFELPAQSTRIANRGTRWSIEGRDYRADVSIEPMRLADFADAGSKDLKITLNRLTSGLESVEYRLPVGFDLTRPFRVFRKSDGREVRFNPSKEMIELTPDLGYVVCLGDTIELESEHEIENFEQGRLIYFDTGLSSPPVFLTDGEREWTLRPKIRPGVMISNDDGSVMSARDHLSDREVLIHYGNVFGALVCLPEGINRADVSLCSAQLTEPSVEFALEGGERQAGGTAIRFSEQFNAWLSQLPVGLHLVEIAVDFGERRFRREWWFWAGLRFVNLSGDLRLDALPANLVKADGYDKSAIMLVRNRSRGVRGNLEFTVSPSDAGDRVQIELPGGGVRVTLRDENGDAADFLRGEMIDILTADRRQITFEYGGLVPTRILCDGQLLGELNEERRSLTRTLGSFSSDFELVGEVRAEPVGAFMDSATIRLMGWKTPCVAQSCDIGEEYDGDLDWFLAGFSLSGIEGVRVAVYDFEKCISDAGRKAEYVELDLPKSVDDIAVTRFDMGLGFEIRINPRGQAKLTIHFDRNIHTGRVMVCEFECRREGSANWQLISCREAFNRLSEARFVLKGRIPGGERVIDPFFKECFWSPPEGGVKTLTLTERQFSVWLENARWLVNFKYPKVVWEKNQYRLKGLYSMLTRTARILGGQVLDVWWLNAIAGLEEHARRRRSLLMPCLLLGSELEAAGIAPRLDCAPMIAGESDISRCFREATLYGTSKLGDLEYVGSAVHAGNRISAEFFSCFANWIQLAHQGENVDVTGFDFPRWSGTLKKAFIDDPSTIAPIDEYELLTADHLRSCFSQTLSRNDALLAIVAKDNGHWMTQYISRMRQSSQSADEVARLLFRSNRLAGTTDCLWLPITDSTLLIDEPDKKQFLLECVQAVFLLAALQIGKERGLLKQSDFDRLALRVFGEDPWKAESLRDLTIGTCPELYSFYYLLLTLVLPKGPKS